MREYTVPPLRFIQKRFSALPLRFGLALLGLFGVIGCTDDPQTFGGSGIFEARDIVISANSTGAVTEMTVREGDRVVAGEKLAEIDTTDLDFQLQQIEHRLEVARFRLDLLNEGARTEDVRQARAQLIEAQETRELAEKTYHRMQSLYAAGSTPTSEIDQVETAYRRALAQEERAQAHLDRTQDATRPQELGIAESTVAEIEAAAAQIRARIQDATIVAPFSGTVLTLVREQGEYVGPGTPLVRLADLSTVCLTVYIPEPKLSYVQLGQGATISVDGRDETFHGVVSQIAEEAEFTPKNVQTADARAQLVYAVQIRVDNGEGIFKIGMPGSAQFDIDDPPQEREAIRTKGNANVSSRIALQRYQFAR